MANFENNNDKIKMNNANSIAIFTGLCVLCIGSVWSVCVYLFEIPFCFVLCIMCVCVCVFVIGVLHLDKLLHYYMAIYSSNFKMRKNIIPCNFQTAVTLWSERVIHFVDETETEAIAYLVYSRFILSGKFCSVNRFGFYSHTRWEWVYLWCIWMASMIFCLIFGWVDGLIANDFYVWSTQHDQLLHAICRTEHWTPTAIWTHFGDSREKNGWKDMGWVRFWDTMNFSMEDIHIDVRVLVFVILLFRLLDSSPYLQFLSWAHVDNGLPMIYIVVPISIALVNV